MMAIHFRHSQTTFKIFSTYHAQKLYDHEKLNSPSSLGTTT
jgi:hypothetical protein